MDRPLTDELIAQYRNPRLSVSAAEYRRMQRYHVKHGAILILIGIIVLAVFVPGGSVGGRGALGVIVIGFGLPLYGLHELIFMRRVLSSELRAKLVWLNPQLKRLEPQKTSKPPVPLARRIFIDTIIILVVVGAFSIWAFWVSQH